MDRLTQQKTLKAVLSITELAKLPEADLQTLAKAGSLMEYDKDEVLFWEGKESHHVWFVTSGKIIMGYYAKSGNMSATCIASTGDTFCCLPTLDQKPYPATAIASVKSKVVQIPIDVFNRTLAKHKDVYQQFVVRLCENLRKVECQQCRRIVSAPARIAMTLLDLQKKYGKQIPLTRSEIAKLAGTTTETSIRTLSQLKKKGAIAGGRGQIVLVDPDQLRRLAD